VKIALIERFVASERSTPKKGNARSCVITAKRYPATTFAIASATDIARDCLADRGSRAP